MQDVQDYTSALDFNAKRSYTTAYLYASLARGSFPCGSHTTGITVFVCVCICDCARNGACILACTGGTVSNRHTAKQFSSVLRALLHETKVVRR